MKPLNCKINRITKLYYWIAWIICNALCSVALFVWGMEYQNYNESIMNAILVIGFAVYIIYLSLLTIKRFHDAGENTAYAILCILLTPLIIGEILIIWVASKDSEEDNNWGIKPEKIEFQKKFEKNREVYTR